VFAPTNGGGLSRVADAGGVAAPVTKADTDTTHRYPEFLPDGRRFLYLVSAGPTDKNGIYIGSLDGPESRRLIADDANPRYVGPRVGKRNGFLLFVRDGTLLAQPVDPKSMQPSADPFPVAENVLAGLPHRSYGLYSASAAGVLAYQPGTDSERTRLIWIDRGGKELGTVGDPSRSGDFALSPDSKRLLIERGPETGEFVTTDLWMDDLEHGTNSRFTFDSSTNRRPVWSADGSRVIFSSGRPKAPGIYSKASNGTGQDELLLPSDSLLPFDWSRDGRFLIYLQIERRNNVVYLGALPLTGDRKPITLVKSQFNEWMPQLSPDSHWLAYVSDESGRAEVYVQPFAPGAPSVSAVGKWQISTAGGTEPRWRGDGGELFFVGADRELMAVEVRAAGLGLNRGTPVALFRLPGVENAGARRGRFAYHYQPSTEGKRFLVAKADEPAASRQFLTVVVNWLAGVKR